jgi:hypothetical protein
MLIALSCSQIACLPFWGSSNLNAFYQGNLRTNATEAQLKLAIRVTTPGNDNSLSSCSAFILVEDMGDGESLAATAEHCHPVANISEVASGVAIIANNMDSRVPFGQGDAIVSQVIVDPGLDMALMHLRWKNGFPDGQRATDSIWVNRDDYVEASQDGGNTANFKPGHRAFTVGFAWDTEVGQYSDGELFKIQRVGLGENPGAFRYFIDASTGTTQGNSGGFLALHRQGESPVDPSSDFIALGVVSSETGKGHDTSLQTAQPGGHHNSFGTFIEAYTSGTLGPTLQKYFDEDGLSYDAIF